MAERTVTIQLPDDVSPHELERLARCASTTDAARLFLDQAAAAIREDRRKPIKLERISQYEWRVDGKIVRLRAWMTPVVFWALSEPGMTIQLDDGRDRRYKQCRNGLQSAQNAIAHECGETIGRLARWVRLRSSEPSGMHVVYVRPVGAPEVIGPTNEEDTQGVDTPTPPKPRKSRAKVFDPWCNAV